MNFIGGGLMIVGLRQPRFKYSLGMRCKCPSPSHLLISGTSVACILYIIAYLSPSLFIFRISHNSRYGGSGEVQKSSTTVMPYTNHSASSKVKVTDILPEVITGLPSTESKPDEDYSKTKDKIYTNTSLRDRVTDTTTRTHEVSSVEPIKDRATLDVVRQQDFNSTEEESYQPLKKYSLINVGLWYGYVCHHVDDIEAACQIINIDEVMTLLNGSSLEVAFRNGQFRIQRIELTAGLLLCLIGLVVLVLVHKAVFQWKSVKPVYIAMVALVTSAVITLVSISKVMGRSFNPNYLANDTISRIFPGSNLSVGWCVWLTASSSLLSIMLSVLLIIVQFMSEEGNSEDKWQGMEPVSEMIDLQSDSVQDDVLESVEFIEGQERRDQ